VTGSVELPPAEPAEPDPEMPQPAAVKAATEKKIANGARISLTCELGVANSLASGTSFPVMCRLMNKKSLRIIPSASKLVRFGALALAFTVTVPNVSRAASDQRSAGAPASVSGAVTSTDGSRIAGVRLVFTGSGPDVSATSDRSGRFRITLPSGTYAVTATANGYTPLLRQTVTVSSSGSVLDFSLARAQASSLTVIGSVRANGRRALDTAPGPTLDINAQTQAARGVTRVSDVLADQLSTTVVPAIGGGMNAPAVVAVRGPDPSETLVDIDGHQANNGSTGDFDLSLLDPADLQSVQVIYGIAPIALRSQHPRRRAQRANARADRAKPRPRTSLGGHERNVLGNPFHHGHGRPLGLRVLGASLDLGRRRARHAVPGNE
jgi:hypothetical protein